MENMTVYVDNFACSLSQRGSYKVEQLYDDFRVYVEPGIVSAIAGAADEDPFLIAVILANIKVIRGAGVIRTSNSKWKVKDKPKEQILVHAIVEILSKYSVEEVISALQSFKWHELNEVLHDENPLQKYEEYLQ